MTSLLVPIVEKSEASLVVAVVLNSSASLSHNHLLEIYVGVNLNQSKHGETSATLLRLAYRALKQCRETGIDTMRKPARKIVSS
jgi:hypothetical protein